MKKVMLVLLLFGMVFGGVYGENVFVGQYSSEGEYTSIFYDSSSLSFTTSYDQAEIYADSYADLITEIYSVNNGNSITVISSGTKYYADESTKKIEFTYKDNQFYFTDESIEILKSGSPVDTDEYKINRNLDEMGFSNDDKLTVFEDVTSNVLPQRSPSTVSIPADVNTQQIEEVNEDNQLIFYDSNGDDIDDEIITLDFSDPNSFIEIELNGKKSGFSPYDFVNELIDNNEHISENKFFNDFEIKKGPNGNSYIDISNEDNPTIQIIGIDQDTALQVSLESSLVKTIPSHLQENLNEYTSSVESLARLRETNRGLYDAIENKGTANIVQSIRNAKEECTISSSCVDDLEFLSNLKNNGFEVKNSQFTPHYDAYDSARDAYNQEKARLANCDTQECRESSSERLKEKEEELNKQARLMELHMDSESAYDYVLNKCQSSNDAQKCQSMITAFGDGASCANSWFPTSLCTFFSDERLVEQSVAQEMENFKNTITDECKSQSSQKFEDCYNDAYDNKLETSKRNFEESAWYCKDDALFCSDDDLIKCSSATECKDKEGLTCKSDDYACKLLEEELEEKQRYTDKEKYVETSTAFDVIAALMNPDQNALLASELFGFESDFSDLPQWLTEDTASLICLAKIDGYLDTQVESQFEDSAGNSGARGITQYGCSLEDGLEFDPNSGTYQPTVGQPCVEVLADLRAERTPLLPTGEVQITYSYYLKSPPNVNISYMLYAGYHLENQSDLELQPLFLHRNGSLDIQVLEAGEDISDFRVARIPENGTLATPIGDESIKLLLQAFYVDGASIDEYVSIISPAYPIEVGSYRDPLGQQTRTQSGDSASGDASSTQEEEQSESVDDEDIRNNACQLMGTC